MFEFFYTQLVGGKHVKTPNIEWQHTDYLRLIQNTLLFCMGIFALKAFIDQIWLREIACVCAIGMLWGARVLLQRGYYLVACNLTLLPLLLASCTGITTNGGFPCLHSASLIFLPLLAAMLGGLLYSAVWFVIALCVAVFFISLRMLDVSLPDYSPPGERNLQFALNLLIYILVAYAIGRGFFRIGRRYQRHMNNSMQSLADELERRALAEQESYKANQAKTVFIANMSHEIRTPLNGIIGIIDALKRSDLSEKQSDYLKHLENASNLLYAHVSGILDFSKIEAGSMQLDIQPFHVQEVLQSVMGVYQDLAASKKITLQLVLPTEHLYLAGDGHRIKQIISNLVSNAIKFTAQGGVVVRVRYTHDLLYIAVTDTGIGMDAATLDILFRPFTQADSSTSRQYGGTGLGLCISEKLANLMGGKLSASSTKGQGSTFTLVLPLTQVAAPAEVLVESAADLSGLNILILEDNEINQLVLSELLTDLHAQVEVCADGVEGLAFLRKKDVPLPGIILSDIQMPNMDGYAFVAALREDASLAHIPVIALTANATAHDRQLAADRGFQAFITKPYQPQEIVAQIMALLPGEFSKATKIS